MNHTDTIQLALVQDIKRGEFVRKITICKTCNGDGAHDKGLCVDCDKRGYLFTDRTFKRGQYDRVSQRYSLEDCNDISREVFVKKNTRLLVGFSY